MSGQRRCNSCGAWKDVTEFNVNRARKDGLTLGYKVCNRAACRLYREGNLERERARKRDYARQWRLDHPEEAAACYRVRAAELCAYAHETHRRVRKAVFDHYGWSCACCGSGERIGIDHVAGNGLEHRAEIGANSAGDMYRWLIANGFPGGFQALCARCNTSKGRTERCRLVHVT